MKYIILLSFIITLTLQDKKSEDQNNENECLIELNIDNKGKVMYDKNIVSDKKISEIITEKIEECKSSYRVKISSTMTINYEENYKDLEDIILKSVEEVQSKYSLNKFKKPLDSLSNKQFQEIQAIYPNEIIADFCCKN
jgi:biopolymer transport protein ExbD